MSINARWLPTTQKQNNKGDTVANIAIADNLFRFCSRVYGAITLGSEVFCTRIPGLTSRQREMCRSSPDAMVAVGDGIRLATTECKYQFRHHRWNCTGIDNPASFGHVVIVGRSAINRLNLNNKRTKNTFWRRRRARVVIKRSVRRRTRAD